MLERSSKLFELNDFAWETIAREGSEKKRANLTGRDSHPRSFSNCKFVDQEQSTTLLHVLVYFMYSKKHVLIE